MSDGSDSWEDYESGPFCAHWGTPGDCERTCGECGHRCHGFLCDECDCPEGTDGP